MGSCAHPTQESLFSRIRSVRRLPAAVAVAATVTGTLSWAPAAWAQSPGPTPSTSAAPTPRIAAETGGVAILTKDPAGDVLAGATFTLLDSAGKEAGNGKTNADGQLTFQDLAPGVYRLKEVSSGSKLLDAVDDQDVIVTPGAAAQLTIIDPFKRASVRLTAKDDTSGKPLSGSAVDIGSGDTTVLTLTTGANGSATAQLPVNSLSGTDFWVKQVKAPDGYDLYKPSKTFTAKPGAPVTVTVTNAKTSSTTPPSTPHREADRKADGQAGLGQAAQRREHLVPVHLALRHPGRRPDHIGYRSSRTPGCARAHRRRRHTVAARRRRAAPGHRRRRRYRRPSTLHRRRPHRRRPQRELTQPAPPNPAPGIRPRDPGAFGMSGRSAAGDGNSHHSGLLPTRRRAWTSALAVGEATRKPAKAPVSLRHTPRYPTSGNRHAARTR